MLELVGGVFLIIGVMALFGACMLLFYTGMQLSRAIEIHNDTMNAIINLRENTQKDYAQIQEWIELMNLTIAEAELKNNKNLESLARSVIELNRELNKVKDSFTELTNVSEKLLN
jgi:galactokinase/mevalonate kinase-like predicted kinase